MKTFLLVCLCIQLAMTVDTDLEFTMDLASYVYPEGENDFNQFRLPLMTTKDYNYE